MLMLILLLLPLSSCFSGGSSNTGADATVQADAFEGCALPVEQCGNCPQTEMTARANAAAIACDNGGFGVAVAGQCGSFRYVEWSGGFGGRTYYFDFEDQLVGAIFSSDTHEYCDGSAFAARIGTVPPCERQQDIDLCAPTN
jgi:hypothetical protein